MADAAPRVLVDDLDQLGDRVLAVADHVAGHALAPPPPACRRPPACGSRCPRGRSRRSPTRECSRALLEAVAHLRRRSVRLIETPRPWLPSSGLTTTGIADARAAARRRPRRRGPAPAAAPAGRGRRGSGWSACLSRGDLDGDVRVSLVTVAWMRCWYLPWPSCTSALVVEADPGDVALLGGAHQRGGRGPEGAALGEADEVVSRSARSRSLGHARRPGALGRQQGAEQAQRRARRPRARPPLLVAVDDVVHARAAPALRVLPKLTGVAGEALQLDRHVLEHVAEPGALVLASCGARSRPARRRSSRARRGSAAPRAARRRSRGQPPGRLVLELAEVERAGGSPGSRA